MKILMVLTSHDKLGNTGRKTGIWLEEFAAPVKDAGLTLVSVKGGQPPIDPKSDLPENQTPVMARLKNDAAALKDFANTGVLDGVRSAHFDAVFYPGGHGPMWDLVDNSDSIALIESFYNAGKPVAAVCHAPGVLRRVLYQGRSDRGEYLRERRGRIPACDPGENARTSAPGQAQRLAV